MQLKPVATLILLAMLSPGLASCGRRGPLELPGDQAAQPAAATTSATDEAASGVPASARALGDEAPADDNVAERTVPDRPFVLDPLL